MTTGFEFSAERSRIDGDRVHAMLRETYWAADRTREKQDRANAGSRCYGVYADGRQVAFARVVTDEATFAWLCDVVVDPAVRGRGIGTMLVGGIVEDLDRFDLRRTLLATADAHGLYARFGWAPPENPDWWMVRPG